MAPGTVPLRNPKGTSRKACLENPDVVVESQTLALNSFKTQRVETKKTDRLKRALGREKKRTERHIERERGDCPDPSFLCLFSFPVLVWSQFYPCFCRYDKGNWPRVCKPWFPSRGSRFVTKQRLN